MSKLTKEEQVQLAARETQLVRRSRIIFVLILLSLTAVAAGLTYYFVEKGETNNLEEEVRKQTGNDLFADC